MLEKKFLKAVSKSLNVCCKAIESTSLRKDVSFSYFKEVNILDVSL